MRPHFSPQREGARHVLEEGDVLILSGTPTRLAPALLARAVPWASFLHLNGREYLRVSTYGWPVQCFLCADEVFDLFLVAWVPGTVDTADEAFLMARVSADRLARMLKTEGMTQREMYDLFDRHRAAHHGDGDARLYDAILDTMDLIVGWCAPDRRLFGVSPEP